MKKLYEYTDLEELKRDCALVVEKYFNDYNFSEINIKTIKQRHIPNFGNKKRGLCLLTSLYTSFNDYLKFSLDEISKLTLLKANIRNSIKNLLPILNKRIENDNLELTYKTYNDYRLIIKEINKNISNNQSCVLSFKSAMLDSKPGHAVSIYKVEKNTIGFIENADTKITLDYVALFFIAKWALENKLNINLGLDISKDMTIYDIYKKHYDILDKFNNKFVYDGFGKFEMDIRFIFESCYNIGLITLIRKHYTENTKIGDINFSNLHILTKNNLNDEYD